MWKELLRELIHIFLLVYISIILLLTLPAVLDLRIETVTSGSMEPAIPVDAVIYVESVPFQDLKEGDIITYYHGSQNLKVTHRIVGIDMGKKIVRTKGDANSSVDPYLVSSENVEGKVLLIIPVLGKIAKYLTGKTGKICLILILLVLFLIERELTYQVMKKQNCSDVKQNEKQEV